MVVFFEKWKKYNKIQLTKVKMDLNSRKMKTSSPFPCCWTVHVILSVQDAGLYMLHCVYRMLDCTCYTVCTGSWTVHVILCVQRTKN